MAGSLLSNSREQLSTVYRYLSQFIDFTNEYPTDIIIHLRCAAPTCQAFLEPFVSLRATPFGSNKIFDTLIHWFIDPLLDLLTREPNKTRSRNQHQTQINCCRFCVISDVLGLIKALFSRVFLNNFYFHNTWTHLVFPPSGFTGFVVVYLGGLFSAVSFPRWRKGLEWPGGTNGVLLRRMQTETDWQRRIRE